MTKEEVIEQLNSLKEDRKSFLENDAEHDEIFIKDIEAIDLVVGELEQPKEMTVKELINIIADECIKHRVCPSCKYEEYCSDDETPLQYIIEEVSEKIKASQKEENK